MCNALTNADRAQIGSLKCGTNVISVTLTGCCVLDRAGLSIVETADLLRFFMHNSNQSLNSKKCVADLCEETPC